MALAGTELLTESLQSPADLVLGLPSGDGLAEAYGAIAADRQVSRERRETAALFSIAEGCLQAGDAEDALQLATEALEAVRVREDREDRTAEADIVRLVIHCFRYREKQPFAACTAEEELSRFSRAGDALGRGKLLLSSAEVSVDRRGQEHCKKAIQWAQEALRVFRSEGQQRWQAMALLILVKAYLTSKDGNVKDLVKRAERAAQEALDLFEALGDRRGSAQAQHCLGAARAHGRDAEGALRASAAALGAYRELGDRRGEAFELQSAAAWRLADGDARAALPDAEEAVAIFQDLQGCGAWEASALGTLGRVLCAQQDAARALSVLKEGLQHLRALGDAAAEARALDALIHVYVASSDYRGALRTAERARVAFKTLGNKQMESLMLRIVSWLQITASEPGWALETAEAAVVLGQELQSNKDKGEALLQLARARLAGGLCEEALKAAEDARAAFEAQDDHAGEGASLLMAASIYSNEGRFDQAGSTLMQAYVLFREAGEEASQGRALLHLCEVQIARGAWEKAMSAAEKARVLFEELGDTSGEINVALYTAQISLKQFVDRSEADEQGREETKLAALSAAGWAVALCRIREDEKHDQHEYLLARSLFMLAQAELVDGRPQEVLQDAEEALALFETLGDIGSQAATMDAAARALCMLGEVERSEQVALQAHALFQSLGDEQGEAMVFAWLEQLRSSGSAGPSEAPPSDEDTGVQSAPEVPGRGPAASRRSINLANLGTMDTSGGLTAPVIQDRIRHLMEELTGSEDVEVDDGLLTAGLTSATATLLGNALAADFPTVPLPATLAFDYPTIGDVSNFILSKIQ